MPLHPVQDVATTAVPGARPTAGRRPRSISPPTVTATPPARRGRTGGAWVVDLDGVVWLSGQPIPGAAEGVERLRQAGVRVVFATNNAEPTEATLLERLHGCGIEAVPEDLVTSAQAAAAMLPAGATVVAVGGPGLEEALGRGGVVVAPAGRLAVDAVVVGLTHDFGYDVLARAALAVRGGARLIGTNDDPTHPTPDGLMPGSGALVAAVATAAQVDATFAGKPHEPMAALLRRRVPDASVVVGDRPATDGRLAARLGVPYALVRSGVVAPGAVPELRPAIDAADLGALVEAWLSGDASASLPGQVSSPTVWPMTNEDGWRRYIEAGVALTQITRARAEDLVREVARTGELERSRAQDRVDELVKASRAASEAFVSAVRSELQSQIRDIGAGTVEELASRVAEILGAAGAAGRAATSRRNRPGKPRTAAAPSPTRGSGGTAGTIPAKKAAARTTAKKTPAKTAPAAKKAAAKTAAKAASARTTAKKAAAKKAAAKAASARTTAKKAATKKAPARTTATKKAPASFRTTARSRAGGSSPN